MGVPNGAKEAAEFKGAFNEIIIENCLNMGKERGNQIQVGQRTLNRLNQK